MFTCRPLALVICVLGYVACAPASAVDVLGLYAGGAVGQARVEAGNLLDPGAAFGTTPTSGNFKRNHSAFKVMVGVRPISLVGAEVAYLDLGHPGGITGTIPIGGAVPISTDVTMKGSAAFGVLYLPVPIVDVYVKAGIARLQTIENSTFTLSAPYGTCVIGGGPHCQFSSRQDVTNTGFAGGAGAQFKFGSLAVRGEYERFGAAGGHPSLFSLGLTWTFF